LLLLAVIVPFCGYLISTARQKGVDIFGLFIVPPVVALPDSWRDITVEVHYWLGYGVVIVACGHALAALKHQLWDKNDSLQRML
jgi:cytochrome b561